QRQREALVGQASKSNRREEHVRMPGKMGSSGPSTVVQLASVTASFRTALLLREGRKSANIHVGSGFIWGSCLGAIIALSAASERRQMGHDATTERSGTPKSAQPSSRRLLGSYGELPCIASSLD